MPGGLVLWFSQRHPRQQSRPCQQAGHKCTSGYQAAFSALRYQVAKTMTNAATRNVKIEKMLRRWCCF